MCFSQLPVTSGFEIISTALPSASSSSLRTFWFEVDGSLGLERDGHVRKRVLVRCQVALRLSKFAFGLLLDSFAEVRDRPVQ